jgi:prepilin-type processing-associated H-X9-DG protein
MIELLVVMAIIMILAATLMPALKGARQAAKKIQCAGNLKNIGAITLGYADDNNGFMPPSVWDDYWYNKLALSAGIFIPSVAYPQKPAPTVFVCPSNGFQVRGATTQWVYSVNYAMNTHCGIKWSSSSGENSQKLENMSSPSASYILMDAATLEDNGHGVPSVYGYVEQGSPQQVGFIHGAPPPRGVANILFGDGHAGSEKYETLDSNKYKVYQTIKSL